MPLIVAHTTVNCRDAHALSTFWAALLGYGEDPQDPNLPGHKECLIYSPDLRHRILFLQVGDLQEAGRLHFDLAAAGSTRDAEIDQAVALGARVTADRRSSDGRGWVVLEDPEGNPFCILRGEQERAAAGDPFVPLPR